MVRALAWEGEVLTSCTAPQTPRAFWPLLSPTAQAFPLLGSAGKGQGSSGAPQAGVPGLLWLSYPFPVLADLPGAQGIPTAGLPPLQGGRALCWAQRPQCTWRMQAPRRQSTFLHSLNDHHDSGKASSRWGLGAGGSSPDRGAEGSEPSSWRRWPLN